MARGLTLGCIFAYSEVLDGIMAYYFSLANLRQAALNEDRIFLSWFYRVRDHLSPIP